MRANLRSCFCLLALLVLGAGTFLFYSRGISAAPGRKDSAAQKTSAPAAQKGPVAPAATQSEIERGRYLVEDVAMCGECHTPRDSRGNIDHSRWLQGASIWIVPVHEDPNWANRAPALAGFQAYTDEQGEQVLEKGIGPNGLPIQEPMHIYHMNHEDAMAIIAYLKSLPGSYPQQ